MDGAGCFQRLSQLLLPWHRDAAPHPPPRESVTFPGVTGTLGGYLGPVVCLPTPGLYRDGRERRVECEGFIRPSRQNPFQMWGCRCWHSLPHWVMVPSKGRRGRGAPRGLQADPTPHPSTRLSWNGDAFFPSPIFPRFGANPQHRPSCDSGMGGTQFLCPCGEGIGVTLQQRPLPESLQLCLSLSLSPLAWPRRCCR